MNQRLREFDLVRAFAALSVIAIHTTAGFVQLYSLAGIWNEWMRYAVPVFIILSGVVLMYTDQKVAMPEPYFAFLRKRLGKVVLPFVVWTLFYVYYGAREVWMNEGWHGVKRIAETLPDHFLYGTGSYHLYFLLITVQLYLLYPLLRAWMKRSPWTLLAVSLAVSLYGQTTLYLHQPAWMFHLFMNWLLYFVFGMFLFTKRDWFERVVGSRLWLWALVCAACFVLLLLDGKWTNTRFTSMKPSVVLYAMVSFLFLYGVALRLRDRSERLFRLMDWISTHSFLIFLVHPLVLDLIAIPWQGPVGVVLLYGITVVLTLLVVYVASFLPFATVFGAVKPKGTSRKTAVRAGLGG
jgi:surface polysaccharide O-acyltransferase-like enzyme